MLLCTVVLPVVCNVASLSLSYYNKLFSVQKNFGLLKLRFSHTFQRNIIKFHTLREYFLWILLNSLMKLTWHERFYRCSRSPECWINSVLQVHRWLFHDSLFLIFFLILSMLDRRFQLQQRTMSMTKSYNTFATCRKHVYMRNAVSELWETSLKVMSEWVAWNSGF